MRPPADVWFHGASLGDARALEPLVAAIACARPGLRFVHSAHTPEGRSMLCQLHDPQTVVRPPVVAPGRALDAVRPRLIVLEYLELWPAWIAAATRRQIPVVVVDGRVTRRSLRIRPLLSRCAGQLSWFSAQTAGDGARARALGVRADRVSVDGNGKYDRADLGSTPPPPVGRFDVVLGSLHPDEERDALTSLAASGLRALVAPRYPKRADAILRAAESLGVCAARRTAPDPQARWLVLDTVGELAGAYGLAPIAVIGGSFGRRGGQNLVEAAAHGVPIVFGPNTANIEVEADAFRGAGGWPVNDWTEAWACVRARTLDPGPDPREALARLRGATARRLPGVLAHLSERPDLSRAHQGW